MAENLTMPSTKAIRSKFTSAKDLLDYLSQNNGFEVKAPIDVNQIAKLLNIEVDESIDIDNLSKVGKISLDAYGSVSVWINPIENSYAPRKRFTLAHEIGHYCLHLNESRKSFIDDNATMSRSDSYWDSYESEANTFAAELLMPKVLITSEGSKILEAYKKEHNKPFMSVPLFVDSLAKLLKVSNKAMEYRLINLGVIKKVS